jgi:spore maturation protein CgeB
MCIKSFKFGKTFIKLYGPVIFLLIGYVKYGRVFIINLVCVCVCVCVCVWYVCIHVYVHICTQKNCVDMHLWKTEVDFQHLPLLPSTLSF